jgi:hypothetical protein
VDVEHRSGVPSTTARYESSAGTRSDDVANVLIGGWAVNAHGYRRYAADVDICPDPQRANLERLAAFLASAEAKQLGTQEFGPDELPGDPTDPDPLAQGGSFRLATRFGILQWSTGIEEPVCERLARGAITAEVDGVPIIVCGLEDLLAMKRAAGRPRDQEDVMHLEPEPADG